MKIELKTEVDVTPEILAQVFVELDDEQMCKFFTEVHRLSSQVPTFDNQWYFLGGHLRSCECSNEGTRGMLRNIVDYMEGGTHRSLQQLGDGQGHESE